MPVRAVVLLVTLSGCRCAPREADDSLRMERVEALRALGYIDVAEDTPRGARLGVVHSQPDRLAPGLTYYTSVANCSSHVINAEGDFLKTWSHAPCRQWGNTLLLPSGDVLAVHTYPIGDDNAENWKRARALIRLNGDNELVWERKMRVHHDVDLLEDGRIATLTYQHRLVPEVHEAVPVRDHSIVLLDSSGEALEESSITDILLRSPQTFSLQRVRPKEKQGLLEIDLVHTNSIEWLGERGALYDANHLLICMRNQDAVAVIDWRTRTVVWSWGPGELSGPHDATLLDNGHILVFDNGLERGWSRAVEVDPTSNVIVWQFQAPKKRKLFTRSRGSSQRLANGNILVTKSDSGVVLEATATGEIVWRYRNRDTKTAGRPIAIVRARRFLPARGGDLPTAAVD